jgi:hypothetical protein
MFFAIKMRIGFSGIYAPDSIDLESDLRQQHLLSKFYRTKEGSAIKLAFFAANRARKTVSIHVYFRHKQTIKVLTY